MTWPMVFFVAQIVFWVGFFVAWRLSSLRHVDLLRISMPTPCLITIATPWFYMVASSGFAEMVGFGDPFHPARIRYRNWYGIYYGWGGRLCKVGRGRYLSGCWHYQHEEFLGWEYRFESEVDA